MGKKRHSNSSCQAESRSNLYSYAGLFLILIIFLALSTLNSIIVPLTQGEDELAHYRYISFISQTGRLPVDQEERQLAWYRADWPPLYHLLVGWTVAPIDMDRPHLKDVGEAPHRRLVGEIFYPRLIILTEDADWPWQDGVLAWHIGRFISIILTASALIFSYLTALELCRAASARQRTPVDSRAGPFGFSPSSIAFVSTGLLAFSPRFLFSSAMLGDDSLFILLSSIFIWLLLRALRGNDRWWVYAVLGFLLGLSIATKYSTGLVPLIIIPVVWWQARRAGWSWTKAAGRVGLSWLFTLIGSSWWFGWIGYYFNTIAEDGLLVGLLSPVLATGPDVSMRRVFAWFSKDQFSGQLRPGAIEAGTAREWLTYLFQTFWGVPVLEFDPLFPGVYLAVLLFCLVALIGLWLYWRVAAAETRATLVVLALVVFLLIPFPVLRFLFTFNILETGQGRHLLYPAAQSIPILLALGWAQLIWSATARWRQTQSGPGTAGRVTSRFILYLPVILLLPWSVFQLRYMQATYPDPLPVQTTTFSQETIPQPLKHKFGEDIQFLGYDFQPDPEQAIINLTLFWQALRPVDENFRTQVQLVSTATGQARFTWLSHPLNGRYPTRAWDEGDVVRDTIPLPLAAVPPDTYEITIDLLPEAIDESLTGEAFQIIQFDLGVAQPIVDASSLVVDKADGEVEYRLWHDDTPARFRQTLPLSWRVSGGQLALNPDLEFGDISWLLVGPDELPRLPAAVGDATSIFLVEADWPSGEYRLGLDFDGYLTLTEPVLTVANQARLFDIPAELTSQPGWTAVEANFADLIKLRGYDLPGRTFKAGDTVPLNLAWQSLAPVLPDTVTFAVLLNDDQRPYGAVDRYPAGYYSPILWSEGEVVPDSFVLRVQPDAPPGVYYLHLGQYQPVEGRPESLPLIHDGQQTGLTAVVIGPVKIDGPPPDLVIDNPEPQHKLSQPVGNQITLVGYDLNIVGSGSDSQLESPAANLQVNLYWQANEDIHTDYTTFLHLRDTANKTVAQKDSPPASGRYPTSLWNAGEVIIDEIVLPLDGISPGEYRPVVGLYEPDTGGRLDVGGAPADEIVLEAVWVEE